MALSLGLTATPEGLKVRQYPQSLTVTLGEMATLSCHFNFKSLKSGVQWFKMKPEKQLIPKSLRRIFVEKNQTSSLVITEVTLEDCGWYFCEVNVLQKGPKLGNGTTLLVLGEKQIVCFRNEHATRFSVVLTRPMYHCEKRNGQAQSIKIQVVKFPLSSSFCLSSFMTDLEIITPARFAVPCIDLAPGIETRQKTRQGGMAKLLCGNPSCGRKAFF
uniref:Ig-like domain-containing protein n=1 Tax=Poecilia mexicana TaxID=48701 RepID=A0A3B3Y2H7_9TELE